MIRWSLLTVVCILLSAGCKHDAIHTSAKEFATLECRAIQLREERFRLADELRKLEENPIAYEMGKDSLLVLAEDLKSRSVMLGDTIKKYIDSLFANHFKDKKSRMRFTDAVRKLNEQAGCGK